MLEGHWLYSMTTLGLKEEGEETKQKWRRNGLVVHKEIYRGLKTKQINFIKNRKRIVYSGEDCKCITITEGAISVHE